MKKFNNGRKRKRWTEMTLAELRAATNELDKPLKPGATKALSPQLRRKWERSRQGKARHRLLVDIEPRLLGEAAAYARQNQLTLSEMVSRGLKGVMAFSE
jgi:hypothetical protein